MVIGSKAAGQGGRCLCRCAELWAADDLLCSPRYSLQSLPVSCWTSSKPHGETVISEKKPSSFSPRWFLHSVQRKWSLCQAIFHQLCCIGHPGEVLCYMCPQELEGSILTSHAPQMVSKARFPSEISDQSSGLRCVQLKIVLGAPLCQLLFFLSLCLLIFTYYFFSSVALPGVHLVDGFGLHKTPVDQYQQMTWSTKSSLTVKTHHWISNS